MVAIDETRQALNASFRERRAVIDGLLTAAIAEQHVLLLGPPGTGKTKLIRAFSEAVFGGSFFNLQFSRFSKPDDVFGPVDIEGYSKHRVYRRIRDGYAWQAKVCFFDEIWKASEAILQALLDMLEDRICRDGGKTDTIPLEMAIGASNEYPESESLSALYDRFALRFWVERLSERGNLRDLILMAQIGAAIPAIKNIEELQARARAVDFAPWVDVLLDVKAQLASAGHIRSDRTWIAQAPLLIKARAVVNGRDSIEPEDFQVLCDALWDNHSERQDIVDIVGKTADPTGTKAIAILDAVALALRDLPEMATLESGQETKASMLAEVSKVRSRIVGEADRAVELAEQAGDDSSPVANAVQATEAALGQIDDLIMSITRHRKR